jgi:hypothetical protein
MRIVVLHDGDGTIRSLAVLAKSFDGRIGVQASAGQRVSLIEGPEMSGSDLPAHLHELGSQHRVVYEGEKAVFARNDD